MSRESGPLLPLTPAFHPPPSVTVPLVPLAHSRHLTVPGGRWLCPPLPTLRKRPGRHPATIHPELLSSRPVNFTRPGLLSACEGTQHTSTSRVNATARVNLAGSVLTGQSHLGPNPAQPHTAQGIKSVHTLKVSRWESTRDRYREHAAQNAEKVYSTVQRPKSQATWNCLQ